MEKVEVDYKLLLWKLHKRRIPGDKNRRLGFFVRSFLGIAVDSRILLDESELVFLHGFFGVVLAYSERRCFPSCDIQILTRAFPAWNLATLSRESQWTSPSSRRACFFFLRKCLFYWNVDQGMNEIQNNTGEVIGGNCFCELLLNLGCSTMQE